VIVTEDPPALVENPQEYLLGVTALALPAERPRERVARSNRMGMLVAQNPLLVSQDLAVQLLGLPEAGVADHPRQLEPGSQSIGMIAAQDAPLVAASEPSVGRNRAFPGLRGRLRDPAPSRPDCRLPRHTRFPAWAARGNLRPTGPDASQPVWRKTSGNQPLGQHRGYRRPYRRTP
jgi:hypothetical protein